MLHVLTERDAVTEHSKYQYSPILYPVRTRRDHTTGVYVLLMTAADTVAHLRNGSRAEGLREIILP